MIRPSPVPSLMPNRSLYTGGVQDTQSMPIERKARLKAWKAGWVAAAAWRVGSRRKRAFDQGRATASLKRAVQPSIAPPARGAARANSVSKPLLTTRCPSREMSITAPSTSSRRPERGAAAPAASAPEPVAAAVRGVVACRRAADCVRHVAGIARCRCTAA